LKKEVEESYNLNPVVNQQNKNKSN